MRSAYLALRRAAGRTRDRIDAWLHPRRGRAAAAGFRRLDPDSVLILCLGNVCRSPYAEWVVRSRAGDLLQSDSAGFIGPGRSPPLPALSVARARGIDHSTHVSKVVSVEMVKAADAVIVFDRGNARRLRRLMGGRPRHMFYLGDFDPHWDGRRAILDPWGKPDGVFDQTFARIERCIDSMLSGLPVIPSERPGTTPPSP